MELLASLVAIGSLFVAAIVRIAEESRETQRRERMSIRTNEKPWNRANDK